MGLYGTEYLRHQSVHLFPGGQLKDFMNEMIKKVGASLISPPFFLAHYRIQKDFFLQFILWRWKVI